MNRNYSQHRPFRDTSRFNEPDRYAMSRPSRYDDASQWNDAQTARWLSHYGGATQRDEQRDYGTRAERDRSEYDQGYGDRRERELPRYGQRAQETWEGYAPEEPWRQHGAERIWPAQHGRYGWRGEDDDQGSLNFQPGERGYAPIYGSTYRRPEEGYETYRGDYGGPSPRSWASEGDVLSTRPQGSSYFGKGPSGYTRSDERIREDVCDRLTDNPHVDASAIQVTVENGVVTLQGQVGERQMKHRAEDCAEHISGVKDVENRLRVSRDAWNEDQDQGGNSPLRDI